MNVAELTIAFIFALVAATFVDRIRRHLHGSRKYNSDGQPAAGQIQRLARKKARQLLREAIQREVDDRRR